MTSADRYSVLVAGGGPAGIAAAIASARMGVKTILIERYGFLGGMATAGLVNPFMSYFTSTGEKLVGGVFDDICGRMHQMGGMLDRAFDPEAMKFAAQELVLESGSDLMLHALVTGVRVDGSKLVGVEVTTKAGVRIIDADCLVDATGDADLAAMAGVPFEVGNPDTGLAQAMTMMFTIGGVDIRKSLLYAKDNPDQMRFPKPSSEESVDQMMKGVISMAGFYTEVEKGRSNGDFKLAQDLVFFISLPTPGQVVVNTTHVAGLDGTDPIDLTRAEIEGRRQVASLMLFMKRYIPGFENSYLLQTATQIGIRETRRI
ncbi:MAG TPA: FAD-dependent oxidoreductase, partial [Armatimonadota bacterium]